MDERVTMEIGVNRIFNILSKENDHYQTIAELALRANLSERVTERYVKLIMSIQTSSKLDEIETSGGKKLYKILRVAL